MKKLNLYEESMEILDNIIENYEGNKKKALEDILQYGCVSGIVGDLTYYNDTYDFFDRHKEEINNMIKEYNEVEGINLYEYFKNSEYGCNKNTLAWWGFEEMCKYEYDLLY